MANIFQIDMLPAREGDCIWVEYGNSASPHRILIDGGRQLAYTYMKARFEALPADQHLFELAILTHVDADHIEGFLKLLEDDDRKVRFKDFWFNGYHHLDFENFAGAALDPSLENFGPVQGEKLSEALIEKNWPWNQKFNGHPVAVPKSGDLPQKTLEGGLKITLLSPIQEDLKAYKSLWKKTVEKAGLVPGAAVQEEIVLEEDEEAFGPLTREEVERLAGLDFDPDTSKANGSSIALLMEYEGKKVLFAGDAHAKVLSETIPRCSDYLDNKLEIDALKVSHHGSRKTISNEVLHHLACKKYLISTDGSRHKHPDREAIARILKFGGDQKHLYFNYNSAFTNVWDIQDLKGHFDYETNFPSPGGENGIIRVKIL